MNRYIPLLLVLGACDLDTMPIVPVPPCTVEAEGPALALDAPSALGFSADDVATTLTGTFPVTADGGDGPNDPPTVTRTLTWTFTPSAAHLDTLGTDPEASSMTALCVVGETLIVDGTLTLSADDGWVSASGPATVKAQGTDPSALWVDMRFDFTPGDDLVAQIDEVSAERGCDEPASDLYYYGSVRNDTPWSTQMGELDVTTCTTWGSLYRLVPLPD